MSIPVKNIYYLLCYAWNKIRQSELLEISPSDYQQLPDLLTKVLVNGCNHLIKQGLDRNYVELTQQYSGVKGKLNFSESLKMNLFNHGKTICQFDDFSFNILSNQLIKGTLITLSRINNLDRNLRNEVHDTIKRFYQVEDIKPRRELFKLVQIYRNNQFYEFVLNVCELIISQISLDEKSGNYKFRDVIRDQSTMPSLFENFVRNFYKIKQAEFSVKSEWIFWDYRVISGNERYIPGMKTDISLESPNRKIVIDTKYYSQALNSNEYQEPKFHSNNLYQIFSYLKNLEKNNSNKINLNAEGILLYPTTNINLDETFLIDNHVLSLCTINMNEDWREIELGLLNLLRKRIE